MPSTVAKRQHAIDANIASPVLTSPSVPDTYVDGSATESVHKEPTESPAVYTVPVPQHQLMAEVPERAQKDAPAAFYDANGGKTRQQTTARSSCDQPVHTFSLKPSPRGIPPAHL
ncbi:hypothetical protein Bbelb_363000 [Branchiostoma belcheri]|nr:hypothetical protein Bbelb_363000 [Branchiostoma belcheri]